MATNDTVNTVEAPVQTPANTADRLIISCGKAKVEYSIARARKMKRSALPAELRKEVPSLITAIQQLDEQIASLLRVRFSLAGDRDGKVLTGVALNGGGHTVSENLTAAKRFRDSSL